MAVTKKSFSFPSKNESCLPEVFFVSAADGTNVVKLFNEAIKAAINYKENPESKQQMHDTDNLFHLFCCILLVLCLTEFVLYCDFLSS